MTPPMEQKHSMRRIAGIHIPSAAYAATSIGSNMMHSIFMFYYVKIYLNRFHVSEDWFQVSQLVFMVWNAINDPLFGYIQDNFTFSWVKSRRHSILYGAPLFVISFLVPWFPWGDYSQPTTLCGIQLMFSLCFYDTMFTFVLLAGCALFTEMSPLQEDRIRLVKYSQFGSLIGSTSVFFTGMMSNNLENYPLFLCSCFVVSVISYICFVITGKNSYTPYDADHPDATSSKNNSNEQLLGLDKKRKHHRSDEDESTTCTNRDNKRIAEYSIWRQMWQIGTQMNFISFVLMNLCQIYQSVYLSNFASIICDKFISNDVVPSRVKSIFYGALFILPQILVILGTPVVKSAGYYTVIKTSFMIKICMGLSLYIIGPQWWMLVIFFMVECAEVNATFSLFNLCVSDVIDLDTEKYKRKFPSSSMVFGTNALITKPAQSLAPMITVAILNRHNYDRLKLATTSEILGSLEYSSLLNAMFLTTCATPVIIGCLQLVIWSFYTIRSSHLTIAKHVES